MVKFKNWLIKRLGGYTDEDVDDYLELERVRSETELESILQEKEEEFNKKLNEGIEKAQGTMKVVEAPLQTELIQLRATLPYGFPKDGYSDVLENLKRQIPDKFFDVQTVQSPDPLTETIYATIVVGNPKDCRQWGMKHIRVMAEPPKYIWTTK